MSVDKQRENREGLTDNKETYGRGEHPNSKANLTPFKEGVSGNPSGRPFKYVNLAKALSKVGKCHRMTLIMHRQTIEPRYYIRYGTKHLKAVSSISEY